MVVVKLFCAIVGVAGSSFPVDIEENETVGDLKDAIQDKKPNDLKDVDADKLQLFLAKEPVKGEGGKEVVPVFRPSAEEMKEESIKWLPDEHRAALKLVKGESDDYINALTAGEPILGSKTLTTWFYTKNNMKLPSIEQVHVLVVVPGAGGSALLQQVNTAVRQDVVWYGMQGSVGRGEGINLNDGRTLSRSALTADIIGRLEETHVVLVKSPPMTGKTSLATLVSRALVNKHMKEKKKAAIFNFSALRISESQTFEAVFEQQCGVTWNEANSTLPRQGYMVYMVLDEAPVIYREGTSSPSHKSTVFWQQVKYVLNDAAYNVRILMFAAYGSNIEHMRLATPIHFDNRMMFTINDLNFSHAEVQEYVTKWFEGVTCFEGPSAPEMEAFCVNLKELTGGHVGLCATAISTLNEVISFRNRSASGLPSPAEWIRMLQTGSLYQANDNALFKKLTSTRAVRILKTLVLGELNRLERIAYGANSGSDDNIVEQCLRKGILAQTEQGVTFSSPVMWRFFVRMRVGNIDRALDAPQTLPDMIARVMRAIDYDSIRQTLGRSLSSDIPLERAWQMEFYKAAYRCTPSTFVTSVDVGALFGSSGFVDFTIHGGDSFWGIELLREASNLAEHIERFSPGGRYSSLGLNEFCLIDFRRVASIDDVGMKRIAEDMPRCEKLFVVCYDARMANVVVFNSAYRIQLIKSNQSVAE